MMNRQSRDMIPVTSCPSWLNWVVCILIIEAIALLVLAFLHPTWLQQGTHSMGIGKCTNCTAQEEDWGWKCFDNLYCEEHMNDARCPLYRGDYRGSIALLTCDFLSVFLSLMLLERFLSYTIGRDYGAPIFIYTLSGLIPTFHLIGLVLYFALTQAGFFGKCATQENLQHAEKPCALSGPIVSLAGLMVQVVMAGLLVAVFKRRDESMDYGLWGVGVGQFKGLSTRVWMSIILCGHALIYALLISGLVSRNWVERSAPNESWEGSLMTCTSCPHNSQKTVSFTQGWDCISGLACELDDVTGQCAIFTRLKDGGTAVFPTLVPDTRHYSDGYSLVLV